MACWWAPWCAYSSIAGVSFQILNVHWRISGASPRPMASVQPRACCMAAWAAGALRQNSIALAGRMLARVSAASGRVSNRSLSSLAAMPCAPSWVAGVAPQA